MFTIGLIEDDDQHREHFTRLLQEIIVDIPYKLSAFKNPEEFLNRLQEDEQPGFDLLLVDIHYKNNPRNGLEFVQEFQQNHPYVDIIFLSSYLEFAPKVYDVEHISFIYKGDVSHYLRGAIKKALENKENLEKRYLKLRWKNTFYRIPYSDIVYIEKVLRKTNVHTKTGVYTSYTRMDDLAQELDARFMRVHFSYIVNRDYVSEFHSDNIKLFNETYIPVSRTYSKSVMDYVAQIFASPQDVIGNLPAQSPGARKYESRSKSKT